MGIGYNSKIFDRTCIVTYDSLFTCTYIYIYTHIHIDIYTCMYLYIFISIDKKKHHKIQRSRSGNFHTLLKTIAHYILLYSTNCILRIFEKFSFCDITTNLLSENS